MVIPMRGVFGSLFFVILILAAVSVSSNSTAAVEPLVIGEHEIEALIPATSQHPELKLNGASMRIYYGFVETYIGKLYVENPTTDEKALVAADEYKRMVFKVAMKRVSGRRMAKAMYDALQSNLSQEEALKLEDRLVMLVDMFDSKLKRGEDGYIEWVPGVGSRIVIKGEVKGIIPGKDLNDAILNIWIGENPVGSRFKKQILGLQRHGESKTNNRRGR